MGWDNDSVIQLIEAYKLKEILWNPQNRNYYNRLLKKDAWDELETELQRPSEEIKRKVDYLLSALRRERQKIAKSKKTGKGADNVYQPSWFAFAHLKFLLNRNKPRAGRLNTASPDENHFSQEENLEDSNLERPLSRVSNIKRSLSWESSSRSEPEYSSAPKRQRGVHDLLIAKKQIDEAFSLIINRCKENEEETNECDLYGQLLAQKMKTLDTDDRLVLMNEIDNIVFKYVLNARKRSSLVKTESENLY
ncbi:unnamed protein product [Colias eurytheme]|nr:unnamed protein product [Colias eurytheme]